MQKIARGGSGEHNKEVMVLMLWWKAHFSGGSKVSDPFDEVAGDPFGDAFGARANDKTHEKGLSDYAMLCLVFLCCAQRSAAAHIARGHAMPRIMDGLDDESSR